MSGYDPVRAVNETGRDDTDWDRIEQALLHQPPANVGTSAQAPDVSRSGADGHSVAEPGEADGSARASNDQMPPLVENDRVPPPRAENDRVPPPQTAPPPQPASAPAS